MKILITAQGADLDSLVDPRFGRAKHFLVVDTETGAFSAHDNRQNLDAAQGAGIQAGRAAVELGVEAVLTGNVGPKAFAVLDAANVAIHTGISGTVKDAIARFKAGGLTPTGRANVEGHWV
ncbi:MAG: NifB/NifX family molybdenum-iron cluster-binding protein [Pirellulales bacterium]|nr:NifB/NifX family molybdenum-iron cluster-binding protein [Pirellulales bacterium]